MEQDTLNSLTEENTQLLQKVERYEHQLWQMRLINDIAEAANNTSEPKDVIIHALTRICRDNNWPVGHAFLVEYVEDEPFLVPSGLWTSNDIEGFEAFQSLTESMYLAPGEALPGIVYRDGEALWANAIRSDSKRFDLGQQLGLLSAFAFPILIAEQVVAVLEFFSNDNQAPDEIILDSAAHLGVLLGRVFERFNAAAEKQTLNDKLVKTSRQAGMAEVAAGVLHNVGNVLNSVTVSATLAMEKVGESSISGVGKVANLLNENKSNLAHFLSEDSKGDKLIEYINQLSEHLNKEQSMILKELHSLSEHIDHIKNIVRRQQHYARTTSVMEQGSIQDIVEDALKINDLQEHSMIQIERHFHDIPKFSMDKHNVMQIINNLVGNAKQALSNSDNEHKAIIFRLSLINDNRVRLEVQDTGCGIPKDIQRNIFQFGFTTKETGHGFGLHTSSNAALTMGGSLAFESEGENKGTNFILELPFKQITPTPHNKKDIAA